MLGPIDFNPFKNVGGFEKVGDMTLEKPDMQLPEMELNEQPSVTIDSVDEEGLVDIQPVDLDFNFNKKHPKF